MEELLKMQEIAKQFHIIFYLSPFHETNPETAVQIDKHRREWLRQLTYCSN